MKQSKQNETSSTVSAPNMSQPFTQSPFIILTFLFSQKSLPKLTGEILVFMFLIDNFSSDLISLMLLSLFMSILFTLTAYSILFIILNPFKNSYKETSCKVNV